MAVVPTPITPLPTPVPQRSDPSSFAARGDAFLGALPAFATETNSIATNAYNNALDSFNSANNSASSAASAFTQAQAAATSAASAAASAGAVQWVSGTTYAVGNVVWSPLTYLSYRRKTPGAGSTDPSLDSTNWALIGAPSVFPVSLISANTNAIATTHYVFMSTLQLTLPANPEIGTTVQLTDLSASNTASIDPGVEKIRGVSGVMNLNTKWASAILVYTGATLGWV